MRGPRPLRAAKEGDDFSSNVSEWYKPVCRELLFIGTASYSEELMGSSRKEGRLSHGNFS